MCTAATYKTKDFYFERTLDYEFSYKEEITITPRNYEFKFRNNGSISNHYAIIGMAYIAENYPLYYDAINEKGLGMAGLNFVGNAHYNEPEEGKDNIAQFEFIPWILSQCVTVKEAKMLIEKINILNISFNAQLPLAQLHWIIADVEESITIEAVEEGINVYDNPVGVLTNNPTFDKNYNPNTNIKIESKLSIHQPLYMETKDGKVDELEVEFIRYLDTHEESIEYFWKNGSEHMNTNFGIAKEDGSAFQPDFLIQFKDGRIGIFDTKAGKGFNENDNEVKSNALQQYITDENKKGKRLIGGLVIENNGTFYYYDRTTYKAFNESPEQWKCFEELFK